MAKKKPEDKVQRLTFDIPESVHRRLKMLSVETGTPMTKLLLQWIEQALAKTSDAKRTGH